MNPNVRELTDADARALKSFFGEMPAVDRTFFQFDVDDPRVVDAFLGSANRIRRVAVDEHDRPLALATLTAGNNWCSHVADLVLLVAPDARGQGLGRLLARTMLIEAVKHGFKKVTVMIAADNAGAVTMFRRLGFEGEALLRDHLRNPEDGELRDTVILAHMVDDMWSTMVTGGFDGAVT